jgi:autotransporter-associated beta strand protein
MKPQPSLRSLLSLSGSALLLSTQAHANYYWDTNGSISGLGDTAGTWGAAASPGWGGLTGGDSRSVLLGTRNTANTAIANHTVYFGIVNLPLGATGSTIGITGAGVNVSQIVFGLGQGAQGVTLSGGGGTITLTNSRAIIANNTGSNTVGAVLNGTAGLVHGGSGTVRLTGANGFTGGVTVTGGGTLQVGDGSSGNLTSQNLTFHSGAGVFNVRAADSGSTQAMGTLTFTNTGATAGEGTVQSTYGSSGNAELSFSSVATRHGGATGNFIVSGGSNGTTNKIVLTGASTGFLNAGFYFGGGSFAAYDAGGFVRALNYGTDTDAAATDTITAGNHVQLTTSPTARPGDTLLSLNLAGGGVNYTMDSGTLTVPAILKSGGGSASTISGGDSLTTASNAEPVIRTDTSSDSLIISSAITGTSGGLTKTGEGTLTLSGSNSFTGVTRVLDGTLVLSGGSAIADNQQVLLANAPGAILQLDSNETVADVYGGGFSGGSVNVQGNTLTYSSNSNITFGGTYTGTGTGGIIKQGTGTLTLSNKNTFTGTFTLEGGAVEFNYGNDGSGTLIPLSSGGAFNLANATTLRFNAAANLAWGTYGSQLQAANGGSPAYPYGWTFANHINITDGTANIRVGGNENSVRFTGNVTGGTSGTQTLAIYPGGITASNGDRQPNVFSGTIADGSGGTLGVNIDFFGASGTAQGVFANLSGQNTFTGPITVTNSKGLFLDGVNGAFLGIGGEVYSTGGSGRTFLTGNGYLGGGNYTNTISLSAGTTLTYLSSANQTLAGEISGNGWVRVEGSTTGTLTLSAANTYTGKTVAGAGTLAFTSIDNVANPNPLGQSSASAANLVLRGGTLKYTTGGAASTDRNFAVFSSSTIDASGSGPLSFTQTGAVSPDVTGITATTTAGSNTINVNSTAELWVGMTVSMPGVPAGRTITTINNATQIVINSGSGVTAGTNSATFGYPGARTLTLSGTNTGNNTIAGVLQNSAVGASILSLSKSGTGTWLLSAANTYTGGTTVTGGTLTVNGSLADATMSISDGTVDGTGGILTFNVSGATIDLITVSSGGTLNASALTVNVSGTLTEPEYVLVDATGGGSISGTLAGLTNGQGYTLNYATANQVKLVAPGGVTFADWRTANSAGSQTLSDDHDNDGVDNGTEFFLGGDTNTTGFTALPPVVINAGTLSVTWTKHPNYPGAYDTGFVVETSDTLGSWTTEPTPPGTVTISGNNVTYTFPGGPAYTGKKFARLKVTGPN